MLDLQRTWPRPISVRIAAIRAGTVPETIVRWCKRDGIGKQLRRKAPWRVDPVGLAIILAGDGEALALYQSGDATSARVQRYLSSVRHLELKGQ
ncbi:hypothetical protein EN780_03015 [Mesorhizobium sp. M4B.F.Ca.ET.089.01.1.1]|uniref:hypothetical protein n=1 Tax=Mesorhizobium sp. M4B.F.Ca.ET.089.01.1.1 TaxID=2496662 RepID=UPI000FE2A1B9|nr:hypothetical protein [Mesorhizobium sp. M4B.F.Ca.ET.089.01.1.1]RWX70507.1 hypothetical protein EN780_03015 [Mesorhizobium sp. M4B.F.Ca.ET.089.01.1.1]